MSLLLLVVVGAIVGWLIRTGLEPVFAHPALARQNYRGASVATAAGIVLPFTLLLVEAGRDLVAVVGENEVVATTARVLTVVAAVAFALLGLFDDVAGTGHEQGFRGHLRELSKGHLTTGSVKLLGGGAVALIISAASGLDLGVYLRQLGAESGVHVSTAHVLVDATLIALAANLGNQLDRRPGRVIKVGVAAFVAMALAVRRTVALEGVAVLVGAAVALAPDDLRERLMLGDTGANVLGACLGLGVVLTCSFGVRVGILAAVVVLNVVGELSSFTRIIDAVPPLRAIDRAGRRNP